MFSLTGADMAGRILGCGDGPASFNAEATRRGNMEAFLDDYPAGLVEGRYLNLQLPSLPFPDGDFDLALCSHFLFLYSRQLDEAFHHSSLLELCRVAKEVRVFPLLALGGVISPHLEGSIEMLRAVGHQVSTQRVNYEFQKGACEMLRIQRADG